MLPQNRKATHPGQILLQEYLAPLGLTQKSLADHLGVPTQRINELVRGKRRVTPDTAWLLAQAFETTPEFWLNLQINHDLSALEPKRTVTKLKSVIPDGQSAKSD